MVEPWKIIQRRDWLVFLLGLSLVPFLAGMTPPSSSQQSRGLTMGKTKQGFAYMSGGVGIEERGRMAKQADRYNLKLSFADRAGEYLDKVRLVIRDEKGGEIVETTASGPWFYIRLPAGNYDVKATFNHHTREIRRLRISKDRRVVRLFHWDLGGHRISRR